MNWRTLLTTSGAFAILAAGVATAQTAPRIGTTGGSDTVAPNPYVASMPVGPAFQGDTLQEQMLRAHQERNKSPGLAGPAGSPSGGVGGTTGGSDSVPNAVQHVIPGTDIGKSAMGHAQPGPYYLYPQHDAYLYAVPPGSPALANPGVGGTTGGSDSVPRR